MGVLMPFAGRGMLPFLSAEEPHKHAAPAPLPTELSPRKTTSSWKNWKKPTSFISGNRANPQTGLVKDRANVRTQDTRTVASIAATGFGLTALCIGQKRGFVSYPDAYARVLATLRFPVEEAAYSSRVSFTTLPTSILAKECGIQKCLPSTPPFCSAEFSPADSISRTFRNHVCWPTRYSIESIGPGFPKTQLYLPTAGCRKWASCRAAGTITVS